VETKAVATKIAADDWEGLVCFFNRIGQPVKTKAPTEKRFMTVPIATLKSRLKMKPINHQVLIMVSSKKY
jgi:hypothetical protein